MITVAGNAPGKKSVRIQFWQCEAVRKKIKTEGNSIPLKHSSRERFSNCAGRYQTKKPTHRQQSVSRNFLECGDLRWQLIFK